MILESLSLTTLRVFDSVFRTRSMSKSAKLLFLTQPGVSQHIRSIEEELEVKLFNRVSRRLIPTSEAVKLHENLSVALKLLSSSLEEVATKDKHELSGEVKIGMPIEVGNNLILRHLAAWAKLHKKVSLKINYDHIHRQIPLLQSGDLDFAITDSYSLPKEMVEVNLFAENLILCCSKDYALKNDLNEKTSLKGLKGLEYITYLDGSPIINQWFQFHYQKEIDLHVKANIMDVQGVLKLIDHGLGCGIIPLHVLQKQDQSHYLIFKGNGRLLKNKISLVYHGNISQSVEVESLIQKIQESI